MVLLQTIVLLRTVAKECRLPSVRNDENYVMAAFMSQITSRPFVTLYKFVQVVSPSIMRILKPKVTPWLTNEALGVQ